MATADVTLEALDARFAKLEQLIERGFKAADDKFAGIDRKFDSIDRRFDSIDVKFAALADDLADIRETMATKDQLIALHVHVNSIERQLRSLVKLESRVADLEQDIFGEVRA